MRTSSKRRNTRKKRIRNPQRKRLRKGGTRKNPRAGNTECPICLEDFLAGEEIADCLVCQNSVHGHCIRRWCAGKQFCPCPYCREKNTFPSYIQPYNPRPMQMPIQATPVNHRVTDNLVDMTVRPGSRSRRNGRHRHVEAPPPHGSYYDDMIGL